MKFFTKMSALITVLLLLASCGETPTLPTSISTTTPPNPTATDPVTTAVAPSPTALQVLTTPTALPVLASPTATLNPTTGRGILSASRSEMSAARSIHTATLLKDGRVLIAGGMEQNDVFLDTAEIYDPTTQTFAPTGKLSARRAGHTATLLPDGRVLITGGGYSPTLASAEIYDPATGRFTLTGSMGQARADHTATLLANGKVLVAGGMDWNNAGRVGLASVELYDPASGSFSPAGNMLEGRSGHAAVLINDGRILIVGGYTGRSPNVTVFASAEIYDPATGSFSPTGKMGQVRYKHAATRLADGKVLVVGGSDSRDIQGRYNSAELYDPAKATFSPTGMMAEARYKLPLAMVLLPTGNILVAGGGQSAEVYDAQMGNFGAAAGNIDADRAFAAATSLPDGQVLVTGGYRLDGPGGPLSTTKAWLYKP